MMAERLRVWSNTNNGRLPSRILFYRDGVGEDQFAMVKRHELQDVRAACDRIATEKGVPGYMPPITMVVCTKRHANRFYPAGPNAQVVDGKTGNFKPGLIVDDRSIRLPQLFDFWLQAHQPLQGTGRPCHYFVLENGMGLTPDGLQGVVSILPFFFGRHKALLTFFTDFRTQLGVCHLAHSHLRRGSRILRRQALRAWQMLHTTTPRRPASFPTKCNPMGQRLDCH